MFTMGSEVQNNQGYSYQIFVPSYEWKTEEDKYTIVIDLPEFRKDQLRVQLDRRGNLRVSGERPLGDDKWRRFENTFAIPKNCSAERIHAKFTGNRLSLILPKAVVTQDPPPATTQQSVASPKSRNDKEQVADSAKEVSEEKNNQGNVTDDAKKEANVAGGESVGAQTVIGSKDDSAASATGLASVLKKPRRVAFSVTITIAVLVGLGIYAAQKLRSSEGVEN
uniref:SHSP domain-containing protein n=1 Tax=Nelumbo nucifera TaxID=4432 RepID=A0A822Z2K1_NELNU|nr:TPA_asm: hypothetical protein HUJ06_013340 [Nelumbo nucifera]